MAGGADIATLGIRVDAQQARDELGRFTGATKDAAGGATGLEASLKSLAAAFAIYKAADWAKDTLLLGARYETLGVVMDVLGRNAGKTHGEMSAFAASLEKTGISMIGARESLARMAGAQLDLAQSSKVARIAQDAAVIANVNSTQAFDTLITGITTGQPRVLRSLGIFVDFTKAQEAFAKQNGITREEMSASEKTQANMNAVLERGALIAGTYTAAMGTAGKQLNSTVRYMEDMRTKAAAAFQPEFTALVFAYANALKFLGDNSAGVSAAIAGLAAAFGLLAAGVLAAAAAFGLLALTPVGLAILAIMAVAGGAVAGYTKRVAEARAAQAKWDEETKSMSVHGLTISIREISAELERMHAATIVAGSAEAERYLALEKRLAAYLAALAAINRVKPPTPEDRPEGEGAAKFKALLQEREAELAKQTALNAVYNTSALTIKGVTESYDALIAKAKDAKEYKGAELEQLNRITDALREQKVAAEALANSATLQKDTTSFRQQAADLQEEAAARVKGTDALNAYRIAHAAALAVRDRDIKSNNDEIRALGEAAGALERARIQQEHDTAAREVAITVGQQMSALIGDTDKIRAESAYKVQLALHGETAATEELRVAAFAATEVRKAEQAAQAKGITLTWLEVEAIAAVAGEQERARIAGEKSVKSATDFAASEKKTTELIARDLQGAFAGAFQSILEGGSDVFGKLWDTIKKGFFKLLSDMIASDLIRKLKDAMRMDTPAAGASATAPASGLSFAQGAPIAAAAVLFSAIVGDLMNAGKAEAAAITAFNASLLSWQKGVDAFVLAATDMRTAFQKLRDEQSDTINGFIAQKFADVSKAVPLAFNTNIPQNDVARQLAATPQTLANLPALLALLKQLQGMGSSVAEDQALAQAFKDLSDYAAKMAPVIDALNAKIAEQIRQYTQDLNVRAIAAAGDADGAAALRQKIADEREMTEATKQGYDQTVLATLATVQQAEATQRAAAAAKSMAQAQEDLNVRELRARGMTDAADAQALWNQQVREFQKAVADGWSQADLAHLSEVQALERVTAAAKGAASAIGYSANAMAALSAPAAGDAWQNLIDSYRQAQQAAQAAGDAIRNTANATRTLFESLQGYMDTLLVNASLSPLSASEQATEAKRQFEDAARKASFGDLAAGATVTQLANTFLQAQKTATGGTDNAAYRAAFEDVRAMVESATTGVGGQLDIQLQQLRQAELQTGILTRMLYQVTANSKGLPYFATGGTPSSGLAIVGERGPELVDFSTSARIYSNTDSAALLSGGDSAAALKGISKMLESQLRVAQQAALDANARMDSMRQEIAELRAAVRRSA